MPPLYKFNDRLNQEWSGRVSDIEGKAARIAASERDAIEFQTRLGEALSRAWVRREHHISLEGNFAEHTRESADPFWIVDVRGSVQSNYNR